MSQAIPVLICANNQSINYGDSIPTLTYTISSTDNTFDINNIIVDPLQNPISCNASSSSNVGIYDIILDNTLFSAPYYDVNITFQNGTLTINKANLTITANNKSKDYDGHIFPTSSYTVSYSGFVNNETYAVLSDINTLVFSGTSTNAINAGNNYTIILSGSVLATNYNISYSNGILTINKVNLTITANNKSKDYDGHIFSTNSYTVSYSGFVNSETSIILTGTLVFSSGTSYSAINSGTYNIIPSGLTSNNYNISFNNGTLTINKVNLSITADNKSMIYTGVVYTVSNYTVSYSGFVNSEIASVLTGTLEFSSGTSYNATNVGTYIITPSGLTSNNYNISFNNGTLEITKKALTVVRTIPNRNYTYGNTNIDYTQFYTFNGFVNSETSSVISGIATIYLNGATISSYAKLNVANYNVTIQDIGTLSATNYSFSNANITNLGTAPKLIIDKAILTVSPITPPGTFTYGDSALNTLSVTAFYTFSGYVLSDTFSNILINGFPTISVNNSTYNGARSMNAGTYNIKVESVSSLSSINYNFSIINPTTLPQFVINKKSVTITFNGALSNISYYVSTYPYYGVPTIQSNIYKTCLSFPILAGTDSKNSLQYVTQGSTLVQTIKFKKSDDTLINSTDLPGSYTITIDILLLTSTFTNYIFTLSPVSSTYTLVIPKGYLTVSPLSPTGTFKYGDKPLKSNLYQITGFVASGENVSTICSGTPTVYVSPQIQYNNGIWIEYTSTTIISAGTNIITVNSGSLSINSSNYSFFYADNTTIGTIIVNKISLSDANITFNWSSYIPPIVYGIPLSNYQLNAKSPLNPNTKTSIGTITYIAENIDTNNYDTTNFIINGTPNAGIYRITATLTVSNLTDSNYIPTSISTVNSSYTFTILKQYPSIRHWNPKPIFKGEQLTSTELSAVYNTGTDPTKVTYCKTDGTILNIGDTVTDDIEMIEKLNDYSNPNFNNQYIFTKVKLFTK